MVRILACKSIGRIHSIGCEILTLCYKKADESISCEMEVLQREPADRCFHSNCPVKYPFNPNFRAEHYPGSGGPEPATGHEVSAGEARGSGAGGGPGAGSSLRPGSDHRSRKCGLRGRKPGQEFRRSGCTGRELHELPCVVSSVVSELPGHGGGNGFRYSPPGTLPGRRAGEFSERCLPPKYRRSPDRLRPRLQAICGGTTEPDLPVAFLSAACFRQERELCASPRALPQFSRGAAEVVRSSDWRGLQQTG